MDYDTNNAVDFLKDQQVVDKIQYTLEPPPRSFFKILG